MSGQGSKIFAYLHELGLTSEATRRLFSEGTRDAAGLKVWRDDASGVIYIDDFYTGDQTYVDGAYRAEESAGEEQFSPDVEALNDARRRVSSHLQYVAGKKVADFGCGRGDFLRLIAPHCKKVFGIELQKNYAEYLNKNEITCFSDIDELDKKSLDVVVSFHVLEHLPDPLTTLAALKEKIVSGGLMIIEVPHANDFLLSKLSNQAFKNFTLWSQHLVLHTRESLSRTLQKVGFEDIWIRGEQRYSLSNHLHWLSVGRPGGHKSSLAAIDSGALVDAYAESLSRLDANDTLVAVAKVP